MSPGVLNIYKKQFLSPVIHSHSQQSSLGRGSWINYFTINSVPGPRTCGGKYLNNIYRNIYRLRKYLSTPGAAQRARVTSVSG